MDWDQLKYFLYIAKSGSLSRAAKALKVNHSTVSRRLSSLEKDLRVRLFDKTVSGIRLTSAGENLLQHALEMEKQVNAARQIIEGQEEVLCGKIRVSTEDTFGYHILPELLEKFRRSYPHIVIDLNIDSGFANLTHREADVAVTARRKPPEHLIGRNLGTIRMTLCATRRYLQRYGTPSSPKDLDGHRLLSPNDALGHLKVTRWIHKNVREDQIIFTSDKMLALYTMVKRGAGLAALPHYLVERDKDVVGLFDLPETCGSEAWVLTHPDLRDTVIIKTFLKYIGDHLRI